MTWPRISRSRYAAKNVGDGVGLRDAGCVVEWRFDRVRGSGRPGPLRRRINGLVLTADDVRRRHGIPSDAIESDRRIATHRHRSCLTAPEVAGLLGGLRERIARSNLDVHREAAVWEPPDSLRELGGKRRPHGAMKRLTSLRHDGRNVYKGSVSDRFLGVGIEWLRCRYNAAAKLQASQIRVRSQTAQFNRSLGILLQFR